MTIHIHAPKPSEKSIRRHHCPDCGRSSFFVGFFTEWYGWDITCLRCGRSFADGEWLPLAFMRGSREKAIAAAKRRYRRTAV